MWYTNVYYYWGFVLRIILVATVKSLLGSSHLQCVQIDAAINPGNSGGPAIKNGKVGGGD